MKIEPHMKELATSLEGKTIKKVTLGAFRDGRGRTAYDPSILFTDDTTLKFNVQEIEKPGYGVTLVLWSGRQKLKKSKSKQAR